MGAMEAKGRRIREGCSQDCIEWMNTTRTDKYSAVFSDIICIDFSLVVKTDHICGAECNEMEKMIFIKRGWKETTLKGGGAQGCIVLVLFVRKLNE